MRTSLLEKRNCLKSPSLSNSPFQWVLLSFISESVQWGKQQRRAVQFADIFGIQNGCSAGRALQCRVGHQFSCFELCFPSLTLAGPTSCLVSALSFSGQTELCELSHLLVQLLSRAIQFCGTSGKKLRRRRKHTKQNKKPPPYSAAFVLVKLKQPWQYGCRSSKF